MAVASGRSYASSPRPLLCGNRAVANYKNPGDSIQPFSKPFFLSFSTSRYPPSTCGEYIRKARLETNLKQADVAKAISVDEMTIVNWEALREVPDTGIERSQTTLGASTILFRYSCVSPFIDVRSQRKWDSLRATLPYWLIKA